MQPGYNILLFAITLLGGSIPLWTKGINDKHMHYLLAFSGSFLLSITFLHLLPETFSDMQGRAGVLMLVGFFLQLLIQRFTHGVEHGHTHLPEHDSHGHKIPLIPILLGLSIHAFMEGLPLGFNYRLQGTEPSLYLAVAAHKLPEAMLVSMLVLQMKGKLQSFILLVLFSLVTPFAGFIAGASGSRYPFIAKMVMNLVPVVAGSFIHIGTTIFFESGTKQHMLSRQKVLAMLGGVGIGLLTLLIEA